MPKRIDDLKVTKIIKVKLILYKIKKNIIE
jgi:hypothetical protein